MKIFYAVQATGNGHVSRAIELLPWLKQMGEVDIFLSGDNCHLPMDTNVKYRSKGVSLYFNSTGGLNYWKILRGIQPIQLRKEIQDLPVEKYDLVINDFEYITAAACARKKIPSVQLGHQASFQSPLTPRPATKNAFGEWVLKNYARSTHHIGLHFESYDDFILPPVIQQSVRMADPVDQGYITVYLPSFSHKQLIHTFSLFKDHRFQIFCKELKQTSAIGNISLMPVDKALFAESMINCHGIICGAGFETPAEALFLGKKLLCIPTRGQYEQLCNAAALQRLGVTCIKKLDADFPFIFQCWLNTKSVERILFKQSIPKILDNLLTLQKTNNDVLQTQRPYGTLL